MAMTQKEFHNAQQPREGEKQWDVVARLEREGIIKIVGGGVDDQLKFTYDKGWVDKLSKAALAINYGLVNLYYVPSQGFHVLGVTQDAARVTSDNLDLLGCLHNAAVAVVEV